MHLEKEQKKNGKNNQSTEEHPGKETIKQTKSLQP